MKSGKRAILLVGALAALLPFGAAGVQAATVTNPVMDAMPGMATGFDQVIDLIVAQRTTAQKLSATDARILREQLQLQYLALTKAEQQNVLASVRDLSSSEAVIAATRALNDALTMTARQALADVQAAQQVDSRTTQASSVNVKLGGLDSDLVFVPTVGPCRVYDSRNGPGQLAALGSRQIFAFSNTGGYSWSFDQGGTGSAGSGNCAGTVFNLPVSNYPVAVVATVGVINPVTTGSMRAWNGGTTLTVGGILGWNAGDVLSNTTVIPLDRTISPYPGSGAKRDFALFNNSGGPVDNVVDVVGYMAVNRATLLDCTLVLGTNTNVPAFGTVFINAPGCAAGYTEMTSRPTAATYGLFLGSLYLGGCRIGNFTGGVLGATCDSVCCRVPGR
jgi:hypothetical protein